MEHNTKIIMITVSEGSIARNILRSFVLEKILTDPRVRVVVVAPDKKIAAYTEEFGCTRVRVAGYPKRPQTQYERIIFFLSRNGIATKTVRADQHTQFLKDRNFISFFAKRVITSAAAWLPLFHRTVRLFASWRLPAADAEKLFAEFPPDLLFATDILDAIDLDFMHIAKRRKVKIIGMVRSWDNLSSGGMVEIVPDTIMVWDPYVFGQVRSIQHIPPKKAVIVGIPHYDWYVKKEMVMPRGEFLRQFGIDPSKKVILFAGIGTYLAPHEAEVAEILSRAIADGKIAADVAVIFRPHPHFMAERERIRALAHVTFDDRVAHYLSEERSSWEMDQENIAHLVNSLYHADVVVTTASTMTIDAVAFNKPVVCIGFDGVSKENYWNSVKRFYRDYTHYYNISKTNGFRIAQTAEELIDGVNAYLRDPGRDREGRKKIYDQFIWRLDGRSADRIASLILQAVNQ